MVYYVVLKLLFVLDIVYVFDDVDFVVVGNLINFILVLYFCEQLFELCWLGCILVVDEVFVDWVFGEL